MEVTLIYTIDNLISLTINIKKMKKLLLLALIALFSTSVVTLNIRIQCLIVSTTVCSSTYQYRATGSNGFERTLCVASGSSCNTTYDKTLAVVNCTRDFKNNGCGANACYIAPSMNTCTTDFGNCANGTGAPGKYSYACRACGSYNASCAWCLNIAKNDVLQEARSCLGANCGNVQDLTVTIGTCQGGDDDLGFKCSTGCCQNTLGDNAAVCIDNNPLLNHTTVTS